jgi:hypothetical protein
MRLFENMSLLNNSQARRIRTRDEFDISGRRECSKKSVQQGRSPFDARSVHPVREHGKRATCLRVAASAKAGNAAGGFFQHSQYDQAWTELKV